MLQSPSCCTNLADFLAPDLFKALSDPNRVALLARLAQSGTDQTVSQVASCCSVDLSVVSRHLKTLKNAGVVASEKRGKEVYYTVRIDDLVGLLRGLADALESCCPDGRCPEAGCR